MEMIRQEPIEGFQVVPLKRIPDERGTVFHMMRESDPYFNKFGEIYFSSIYYGVVKAWHKHKDMTLNYACIYGRVKVVVYDDREDSQTKGNLHEVFLGPDNYSLVIIPPVVWNGFKGMHYEYSIIANCCTHEHEPSRSVRLNPYHDSIPYDWARKDY